MTIISSSMLSDRIPGTSNSTSISNAVSRASAFVNTWTSKHYDPFDDFAESPETILAPPLIGEICLEVAEAFYYLDIGQTSRDGNDREVWQTVINNKKLELETIAISPTWATQSISLNTYSAMIIGSRTTTGGMWPRVIPQTAQVISGTNKVWVFPDDWYIRMGGIYDDEYRDAWYLDVTTGSGVEGTLRYMRTWRCDAYDYAKYSQSMPAMTIREVRTRVV